MLRHFFDGMEQVVRLCVNLMGRKLLPPGDGFQRTRCADEQTMLFRQGGKQGFQKKQFFVRLRIGGHNLYHFWRQADGANHGVVVRWGKGGPNVLPVLPSIVTRFIGAGADAAAQ